MKLTQNTVTYKRSISNVLIFKETLRHSSGAKFALTAGYIDLFVGVSLLSLGGATLLWTWRHSIPRSVYVVNVLND